MALLLKLFSVCAELATRDEAKYKNAESIYNSYKKSPIMSYYQNSSTDKQKYVRSLISSI